MNRNILQDKVFSVNLYHDLGIVGEMPSGEILATRDGGNGNLGEWCRCDGETLSSATYFETFAAVSMVDGSIAPGRSTGHGWLCHRDECRKLVQTG